MNILGISDVTGNHSHSCVAILQDGDIRFALSQERISRVKNDSRFPTDAIDAALSFTGLALNDIDYFACGYPPANYYGSLLQHGVFDVPRALGGIMARRPVTLARYLMPNLKKGLFDPKSSNGLFELSVPPDKFAFVDHHLAHVTAGYFASNFERAIAISYGGFAPHHNGQNVAGAVYLCEGDSIKWIGDIPMYATGCYYSGITVALGFNYMAQEGKTMGLAKTGDHQPCYDALRRMTTLFRRGSWKKYDHWVDYIMSPRASAFLGTKSGGELAYLIEEHGAEHVAAAAQKLWERNIQELLRSYCVLYNVRNFVLTGGTFLNVQINSLLAESECVENIFVHPHTGDGSTTLGAMLNIYQEKTGKAPRHMLSDMGLGIEFSDQQIQAAIREFGDRLNVQPLKNPADYAAEQLSQGKVIGWFQGREEYGHRSLGHRCLLGDPRHLSIKEKMTRIKNRESWIPIAPSVLAEHGSDYFFNFVNSPFMTRVYHATPRAQEKVSAALHVDGTARAQSVDSNFYQPFRRLLERFHAMTGIPMVLNTSLNKHAEPIVHQPKEAIEMLLTTAMDELVIGSFAITKIKD